MECRNCSFINEPDYLFCHNCGEKLKNVCPDCNNPNDPEYLFCMECGHNLAEVVTDIPGSEEAGEKKPLDKVIKESKPQQAQTEKISSVPASEELEESKPETKVPPKTKTPPIPEYVPASEDQPQAVQPPPQVVIIRETDESKKRLPGWLWAIIGAVILLLLILLIPKPTLKATKIANNQNQSTSQIIKFTNTTWVAAYEAKETIVDIYERTAETVVAAITGDDIEEQGENDQQGSNSQNDDCADFAENVSWYLQSGLDDTDKMIKGYYENPNSMSFEVSVDHSVNQQMYIDTNPFEHAIFIPWTNYADEHVKIILKGRNSSCEIVDMITIPGNPDMAPYLDFGDADLPPAQQNGSCENNFGDVEIIDFAFWHTEHILNVRFYLSYMPSQDAFWDELTVRWFPSNYKNNIDSLCYSHNDINAIGLPTAPSIICGISSPDLIVYNDLSNIFKFHYDSFVSDPNYCKVVEYDGYIPPFPTNPEPSSSSDPDPGISCIPCSPGYYQVGEQPNGCPLCCTNNSSYSGGGCPCNSGFHYEGDFCVAD